MKYYEFAKECDNRDLEMLKVLADDELMDAFILDDDKKVIELLDKAENEKD